MLFLFVRNTSASTPVSTKIELTEDAINLFLNEKYNEAGFVSHISGTSNGVTYDIRLLLPSIALNNNSATITTGFKISSSVFTGTFEFVDNVSFQVPSINDLTVKALYSAFVTKVNQSTLNSTLKTLIINTWSSLQWTAYPEQLANKVSNSDFLKDKNISIVDPFFAVSFDIDPDILNITLTTYLNANEYFVARISGSSPSWTINLTSGSETTVSEVHLYGGNGGDIWAGQNLGTMQYNSSSTTKNYYLNIPMVVSLTTGYYYLRVVYRKDHTFYEREFQVYSGSTAYYPPTRQLN